MISTIAYFLCLGYKYIRFTIVTEIYGVQLYMHKKFKLPNKVLPSFEKQVAVKILYWKL